jgi:hypothetical protein
MSEPRSGSDSVELRSAEVGHQESPLAHSRVGAILGAILELVKPERRLSDRIPHLPEFFAIFVLTWLGAATSLGQTSVQEFRNVLRDRAAFTADDFAALERGEIVVKLLPVKDKREVAVCGVVRTQAPLEASLNAFRTSMTQQNQTSILQAGTFSSPPALEDLQALTLEDRDLKDLKRCVVGDCKLKMSAAMIERFRTEVAWAAPDYRLQANSLFRQMLLDYVRDYLARGDSALIEYQDQSPAVRLDEEHRELLEASLYVNDFAAEFTQYLKGFPKLELREVENSIDWAKIKFGLKPVTILTHVATYTRRPGGVPQILVVSKQLYADHYFDSSLALTALINVPTTGTTADSYLLYTNRSRAASLAGSFSKLKRNLVEDEAVASLNAILFQTRLNLESSSINQANSRPRSGQQKIVEWLFGGTRPVWWLMIIIVLIALFGLRRRNSKRTAFVRKNKNLQ